MSLSQESSKNLNNVRGFILALLMLALIAAFHLMVTSTRVKRALRIPVRVENSEIRLQKAALLCQSEQLSLTRYLLAGDRTEAEQLEQARTLLHEISPGENRGLQSMLDLENNWYGGFVHPLVEQRRELNAGHGTFAELQASYLQLNAPMWEQRLSHTAAVMLDDPAQATFEGVRTRIATGLDIRLGMRWVYVLWLCWSPS